MNVQPHLLNLSAYINQNLEKDLPLSSLAKRVGLSPFHFHRKFGAYFGESLHQHIKRLRLERAAYALRHGTTPVRQIARESGYKTVSAFSHAFSGFAGESPTRYRSLGIRDETTGGEVAVALEPAWIGDLEPQAIAFVRTVSTPADLQQSVREAIDHVTELAGAALPATDQAREVVAVTSDVFRVSNGDDFRMDVGFDLEDIAVDRQGLLGTQVLPGGRYARFDLRCLPGEAMALFAEAALHGHKETPRLSQYFVRFSAANKDDGKDDTGSDGRRDYRLFVPVGG